MTDERRRAPRVSLPDAVEANVGGATVRLIELSAIGGRIEHEDRFQLDAPQLGLQWHGAAVTLPIRVMRSQIVGRRDGGLLYQSGVEFSEVDDAAQAVIASILRWADQPATTAPAASTRVAPKPAAPAPKAAPSFDDTWTRRVQFMRSDMEDDLPYAQFRLRDGVWIKDYVASPAQPEDGFTIPRTRSDSAELQRTFECADPETRRMMRIALESQVGQ